ncbi:hypothetical protein GCM10023149_43160 [Mucilaginibacter gynuensis]|uniref:GLPGLI family protein n=1 Tax=Mucilaginibacter gynuensis TaxID=1302236 RepID=A0ABP8H6T9_9SPHI
MKLTKITFPVLFIAVAIIGSFNATGYTLQHAINVPVITDSLTNESHIAFTKLTLHKSNSTKSGSFGQPLAKNQFGKPNSIIKEFWETEDDTATTYRYTGAKIHYLKGKMCRYEITGANWAIGPQGGPFIKVGAKLSSLLAIIPDYKSTAKDGVLSVRVTAKGKITDGILEILYNPATSVITKISTVDYD